MTIFFYIVGGLVLAVIVAWCVNENHKERTGARSGKYTKHTTDKKCRALVKVEKAEDNPVLMGLDPAEGGDHTAIIGNVVQPMNDNPVARMGGDYMIFPIVSSASLVDYHPGHNGLLWNIDA